MYITRYAKSNNEYMKNYNPDQDSNYLIYLDTNNLYEYAMNLYLPYGNFKWSNEYCEFDVDEWKNKILEMDDNSDTGYIFEVDLEYPKELHDYHKDLPLAPEGRLKLVTTLENKENYVMHYRNLKQCLEMGLRLSKIHRILEFSQSDWLEKFY